MTTFSIETRINQAIENLDGLSGASFAALASEYGIKVSKSTLNDALSGGAPLSNNLSILLSDLVARLENLNNAMAPVPLSFRDPKKIAELLRQDAIEQLPAISDLITARKLMAGETINSVATEVGVSPAYITDRLGWLLIQSLKMSEHLRVAVFRDGVFESAELGTATAQQ